MLFAWEGDTVPQKLWSLIRSLLTLPRFDLFLQGSLLMLTYLDGFTYLLLRRSAEAGLLTGSVEDWVLMGASGAEACLGALLAWSGRGRRPLALSAWLAAAGAAGALVVAFPQPDVHVDSVELCNSGDPTIPELPIWTNTDAYRTAVLVVTAVLCALTRISIWAHGITYLDDHDPTNGVYVYGLLISIRFSIGTNVRNLLAGVSRGEGWFDAQVSFSALILMFAFLFTLFPKRMPGWQIEEEADKEGNGFFETLHRLVRNKALVIQTVALALINTAIWGFVYNEDDYVRARYYFDDVSDWSSDIRTSRLLGNILRTFVVIYFIAIFRSRFSGRRRDGVAATTAAKVAGVLALMAAGFFFGMSALRCGGASLTGGGDAGYAQPECSGHCGCRSEAYGFAPVCALDTQTTFFSPCHAGCSQYEDLNGFLIFDNCTCGGFERAVRGHCNLESCHTSFVIYQIFYVNALALSAASILMQGMVLLRAVRPSDKLVSIGAAFGVVALIAHVPGHLLYMFMNDATCALKDGGRCLLHTEQLPYLLGGVSGALALLSAGCCLFAFLARRAHIAANVS